MLQPPQKELELLSTFGKKYIFVVGFTAALIVLLAYFIFTDGELFRRTAAFSVLVLIQSFILIDLWLSHQSMRKHYKKLISAVFLLAFSIPFVTQYLLVKIPAFASAFKIRQARQGIILYLSFWPH